jgi:CDP-diacylglycerol---serine O-phosphatidyltransferase
MSKTITDNRQVTEQKTEAQSSIRTKRSIDHRPSTIDISMKQIPNIVTLLNLFFGCLAIIFILQPGESIVGFNEEGSILNIPEKITWGCICIGIAAIVDFLDGFVARLFKASSEMGKQLDSLADAVSFGVAPGMIMYQLLRLSFAQGADGLDVQMVWLLPALLIPCFAVYRLAKFNLDTRQSFGFIGVPTPAAGLLIASLPLVMQYDHLNITPFLLNKWTLYGIIAALCFLMVSEIPILSMKFKDYTAKNNIPKIILAALAVVCAIFLHWLAVPVVFIAYVILSLVFKNKPA